MTEHKKFYRGIFFALAGALALDLLLVHQLIDHHHIYNHPSVNIVEPILAIVFIVIAIIIFRKEFNN